MDIIRLRILSFKSILGFGKYADMSVQQIIDNYNIFYLVWIYFNIEGISFKDEVLDVLSVVPEIRIKKPGINKENFDKYEDIVKLNSSSYKKEIIRRRHKGREKGRMINFDKVTKRKYLSKSLLQRKNQGHK